MIERVERVDQYLADILLTIHVDRRNYILHHFHFHNLQSIFTNFFA
jgi:hypothetical protein